MADPPDLAAAIAGAASALSASALGTLVKQLRDGAPKPTLRHAFPATNYQQAVDKLLDAWDAAPAETPNAIALALEAVAASNSVAPRTSIVWTGPTTDAVAVRRTDQALIQLINRSATRLIVVSFAVYRVPMVAAALKRAAGRGVRVDLVVETVEASDGKITFDGWEAFGIGGLANCRLWTWAHDRRPAASSGKLASLHAKCAVSDGTRLLVSSANLTEFAHHHNM